MGRQEHEVFTRVKDRFLAAAKDVVLSRLKVVSSLFPEVDPDLVLELVLLTGIGFLGRLTRHDGREGVAEFLDNLLQELTIVVCQHDEGLAEEMRCAVEQARESSGESEPEPTPGHAEVQANPPLPGVGLFGFHFAKGDN